MTISLEVGKSYFTRDRTRVVKIIRAKENNIFLEGEYFDNDEEELIKGSWNWQGYFISPLMLSSYDLVKEYKGIS